METLSSFAFNPSSFEVVKCKDYQEKQKLIENRKQKESGLFNEVVEGLTKDLEISGFECTYSSKIIINMVAQNVVLMQRFKFETAFNELVVPESKLVFDKSIITKNDYFGKTRNERYYDNILIGERIDPLFEKSLPKIQKRISEGLKSLGLHPIQLIERQKITIVKKIRQKCEDLTKEISIKTNN